MNLYILPISTDQLKDNFFDPAPIPSGGQPNVDFWNEFSSGLKKAGVEAHTTDYWSKDKSQPDDILMVINHPGETFLWSSFYFLKHFKKRGGFILERRRFLYKNYRYFKKRILYQGELPVAMPYVYNNLPALNKKGIYTKILLICKGFGNYDYFNHYLDINKDITSQYFDNPKNKFLVMINSNIRPHSLKNEYYSERLKLIKYFSRIPGFDLYGYFWDKRPRHPFFFHYGKYVRHSWRGTTPDKVKTLSEYKFSLCLENCIYPGFVSEKIFDSLAAGCIPIYLGPNDTEEIVPKSCFVNFRRFNNYDKLYHYISALTEKDLNRYRDSIKNFLKSRTPDKGIDVFVHKLIH